MNANLSEDLLAIGIRQALYHFGEITEEISIDELLGNILHFIYGEVNFDSKKINRESSMDR